MRPSATLPKKTAALLLLAAALLLSGCVYLRLLELKKQLAHFDEHFTASTADGVALTCLHPVLKGDDLRWIGAEPKTITPAADGEGEDWLVRWVKEPPPGADENAQYDVELHARLRNDRLAEVHIPDRYFAYFPKELFMNLLRSAGTAKVDRGERQAESRTETPPEVSLPKLETIAGMLGRPTLEQRGEKFIRCLYRYRAQTADKKAKPIEVIFAFDPAGGELRQLVGQLPHGTLRFDFTGKAAK